MESLRVPKVERNCSGVMTMPSFASARCHEIQWNSSESTRVPSISHRTARLTLIGNLPSGNLERPALCKVHAYAPGQSADRDGSEWLLPDFFRNLGKRILFQVARIAVE